MNEILDYNIDMAPQSVWRIVTAHPFAKNELLYVQELGDFYSGKQYFTVREGLDSYLIKLTLSGKGCLEYDGKRYELTAGRFFWIDCKKPQSYRTDAQTGQWHIIWVHFRGANADAYYRAFLSLNAGSPVAALPVGAEAVGLLRSLMKLYEEQDSSLSDAVYASALLTSLLCVCIRAAAQPEMAGKVPEVILEVKNFLLEHYEERITLSGLAERFPVSKYHLQRLFKKHIGQSPAEYLNGVRLVRAKELLRTTELPVSEIAYRVGVENVSYFISMFRAKEGTTPQKYRACWSNT